jgi:hypothetical protein
MKGLTTAAQKRYLSKNMKLQDVRGYMLNKGRYINNTRDARTSVIHLGKIIRKETSEQEQKRNQNSRADWKHPDAAAAAAATNPAFPLLNTS